MPSVYIISTGGFFKSDGSLLCECYAGHPSRVNDPEAVAIKDVGPLPPGVYTIGKPQNVAPDSANWMANLRHMGPFIMALTPDPGNEMFGRSGFYCHGDSVQFPGTASNGCLIPARHPDGTPGGRDLRMAIAEIRKTDDALIVKLRPDSIVS